ncbi:PKD domain-containing protein [Amycolatopsis sp. FBCC-B4732]|uniref:PKD domain-containing protein n=1 Tax=Amycolatopsis sp. FBCC-B4732 TaxID=3079339 RepID=UPI001FF30249|nr:PKD domain-containing protein [Amycolatopsis sp. FBCC-B4732]UOX91068.1 PKD domain-containing protein [Amycolatopsis sp. FBCC-B4732]
MLFSSRSSGSRGRTAVVAVLAAALATAVPGVAHAAAPPANDDFDSPAAVAALPFTAQEDTGGATEAADDPVWCEGNAASGTVWFRYTATQDGLLRATTTGSDHRTVLSASTGARGHLQPVADGCDYGTDATITFRATAGTTYSFQVSGIETPGGALSFALDTIAPAANDAFADAEPVTALPFTRQPDLSLASTEAGEPASTCVDDEAQPSVWYSLPAADAARSLTARVDGAAAVTVYAGNSLAELTQVACRRSSGDPVAFGAAAGTRYAVRVTGPHRGYGPVELELATAPPLDPYVYVSPTSATVFDNVGFSASSYQAIDRPLGGTWDFGDGKSAPVGVDTVYHRYAADGVYPAALHAKSPDGRTKTVDVPITVLTHDVGIAKFVVPTSARQGESKPISVDVTNTRYAETVTVALSKLSGDSWTDVGRLTLQVPARATGKVRFPFSYTFGPGDALSGKVAFRADVRLQYPAEDAFPADNTAVSIATTVKPPATRIAAV